MFSSVINMTKKCNTNLDNKKWTLFDSTEDEDLYARYDKEKHGIEIVNLMSVEGWGEVEDDDPDYGKCFVSKDYYDCKELTIDNPNVIEVAGKLYDEYINKAPVDIAIALYSYGFTNESQKNLPKMDCDTAYDEYIKRG